MFEQVVKCQVDKQYTIGDGGITMKGREEEIVISVPISNARSLSPNFLYLCHNYLMGRDMIIDIEGTNLLITYAFIFKYNLIILR